MSRKPFERTPATSAHPSAHRTAENTDLHVTNHCLDRFRRVAPHLANRPPWELRALIMGEIENGTEATPEQLRLIHQSRARLASSLSGRRKFSEKDKTFINNFVAYVTEHNDHFGPLVVTCYEVEYLRVLEREQPEQPKVEAPDEWPWEWEPLETPDPYEDLLRAYRNGDNIQQANTYYLELSGEPGAVMQRGSSGRKWRPIGTIPRAALSIKPCDEIIRKINRKNRKALERERVMQRQQNAEFKLKRGAKA